MAETLTLYGLKTCDSCKKALKALEAAGAPARLVDIRAEADLAVKAPAWLAAVGQEALLNTRSTTWRGLSDAEKASATGDGAAGLLIANPTLIKRPVIEAADGRVFVGWSKETAAALA
ncbi:MAG: ArsC/Spx/MgsR family protein [Pseudomonadota bacterium]